MCNSVTGHSPTDGGSEEITLPLPPQPMTMSFMENSPGEIEPDASLGQTWTRFLDVLELIRDRFHLREKLNKIQDYAGEHPVQALCIAMVLSLSSIPVICFIIFSCVTMIVTFICFVCFEGFLLSFGAIALGGAIFVSTIIALILCGIMLGLASTYTGGRYAYQYFQGRTFSHQLQELYLYCMRQAENLTNSTRNYSSSSTASSPVNPASIPESREHVD